MVRQEPPAGLCAVIDALLLDMLYSGLGALSGAVVLYGLMWLADWP